MDAEHTIVRQARDRPSAGSGQAADLSYAPRMSLTRRDALKLGALGPLALLAAPRASAADSSEAGSTIRFAVSTYSYWHFEPVKYPVEKSRGKSTKYTKL